MTKLKILTKQLYEEDYVLWIEETAKQIRNQDVKNLDWEHLLEEIEDLARELKHKVDSYLLQLLLHLLIYQYWEREKEWCRNDWRDEIDNFRVQLELLFESKTLYNYFLQRIDLIYLKARRRAITKTQLSSETFSQQCPFSPEQILDASFFPN